MSDIQKVQGSDAHKVSTRSFQDPDPNDPDTIIDDVKLTRWDKASRRLRDLVAKRDALPLDHSFQTAAILDAQIVRAREALKRAEGDVSRRQESIDEWRADAGRETYNSSRRNGRGTPHADVASMTPEQRQQHDKDGAADRAWRRRCRKAGWPEVKIQAELVVRIRSREAKRAASYEADEEQAELERNPMFGAF
ncbi:hypothetical protein [Paracoccus rhizosphaerae]|uniref:Replication region DNA-binding N-term n=1 Tax=Paracoccus rhizosphaerae TaxID=1133347 RepID=A0ABV6CII0_9RHOB|nr:hypothetical protein [Paracoccus rhizosphaerae]